MKIILFLMIVINSLNSQNINGKWVLKDMSFKNSSSGYPGFQLLEIKDSIADFYTDFSLQKKSVNLKVLNNKLVTPKDIVFAEYKVISDNHLQISVNGKSNNIDVIFKCDFYKLKPTITKLNIQDIEKLTYIIDDNGKEKELIFNRELWDEKSLELFKQKEGEKKRIEKIDSTFFISVYFRGERGASIPIKEATEDFLKLYAIPTGPMELTAYRKK